MASFLVESRKDLKEDPQERLLTDLLNAYRGIPETIPQPVFRPTPLALLVNWFWFASLTLTLTSALAGVLAKYWLAKYNPVSRRERASDAYKRQFRFNMAEASKLEPLVSSIPFLIQISLFLFFIGLLVQIHNDHASIQAVVYLLVAVTFLLYIFATLFPLFVPGFPFPTPIIRFIEARLWPGEDDSERKGWIEKFGWIKEHVPRAWIHHDPIELQLQILSWGTVSTTEDDTIDETTKALSGVQRTKKLRDELYGKELHKSLFDRLEQKFKSSPRSSLTTIDSSQLYHLLLALLKIEQPLNFLFDDEKRDLVSAKYLEKGGILHEWDSFKPFLQPLAFSLKIHLLINSKNEYHQRSWPQKRNTLDDMIENVSTRYVRKTLMLATLRGLWKGGEYTRQECGIAFSQLLNKRKNKTHFEMVLLMAFKLVGWKWLSKF